MKRALLLLMLAAGVSQAQYQMVQWSKLGTNDTAKMAGANWGILSKFVTFPDGSKITTGSMATKQKLIDSLNAASPWLTQMTRSWQFDSTIQARQTDFPEIAVPANPAIDKIRLFAVADADFTVLETLTDLGIRNRLNQDVFRIARNTTGSPITAGQVVYFNGSTGNKPDFALAEADIEAAMPAVGVTTATVADNGFGEIMIVGRLTGVKTDYEGWTEGDPLYVSPTTPGGLTDVRPTHPNFSQWIGTVEVVHANAGVILINVQAMLGKEDGTNRNSYTIGDQGTGVKSLIFDGLADGTLSWNSATSNWGLTSGYLMLGTDTAATRAYARGIFPNNTDTSKYIEDGQATASLGALVPSGTSGQMGWFKRNAAAPESGTITTATTTDTLDWQSNTLPPIPLDINAIEKTNDIEAAYDGIGVKGATVNLRFDDGAKEDSTFVLPNLVSRNLVGGFAIVTNLIGVDPHLSLVDIQNMQLAGMEIISHSYSHGANPLSFSSFLREVKDSKDTLESKSLWIQHFIQPGTWTDSLSFTTEEKMKNRYATILKAIYPTFTASRPLTYQLTSPARTRYGVNGIGGTELTVSQLVAAVDKAIKTTSSIQLFFHSADFGGPSKIDTTSFKSFLDSLKARVDSGLVSVLTPSAALFAKRNPTSTNYIFDGGFELSQTGNWKGWSLIQGTPYDTVGGRTGRCAKVKAANYIGQYFPTNSFRTLRFKGYVKRLGVAVRGYVFVGFEGQAALMAIPSGTINDDTWTKVEFTFTVPPTTTYERFYIYLSSTSEGWVLWDDVSLTKDGANIPSTQIDSTRVIGTGLVNYISGTGYESGYFKRNATAPQSGTITPATATDTISAVTGSFGTIIPSGTSGQFGWWTRPAGWSYLKPATATDTTRMAVGYFSGNVGIGTTAPSKLLHVYTTGAAPQVLFERGAAGGIAMDFKNTADEYIMGLTQTNFGFIISGGTNLDVLTPSLFIKRTTGNVGIGTTVPASSERLAVKAGSQLYVQSWYRAGSLATPVAQIDTNGSPTFAGTVFLRAGTATAGTAPLKFQATTPLTVPEPYVLEPSADGLYLLFTRGSGVRDTLKTGGASATRLDSAGGWYRTGLIKTDVAGVKVMIRGTDGDTVSTSLLHVGGTFDVTSTASFAAAATNFGTASSITGTLVLNHASNANTTTITPSTADGTVVLTTPNITGTIAVSNPASTQTFAANNVWNGTAIDTAYLIASTKYHNQAQWTVTGLPDSLLLIPRWRDTVTTGKLTTREQVRTTYSVLGHGHVQNDITYLPDSIAVKPTRTELTTLLAAKQNTISNLADTSKYVEGLDSLKAAGYATRTMLQADTLYRAAQSLLRILYSDTTSTVANQWRLGYKIGVLGYSVGDTSAFTTTATRKAIYVSGARENQVWQASPRIPANTTLPVAGDWVTICPKWDSVVVKRPAGTTSGLKFNYWRVR